MKKQFLILFAFISVLTFGQVPQRFNKVIVTGDITSPKFIKTGSNADSVLLGNGSARAISAIKTDTVSLSNRINAKATGNGTANGANTGDETLTSIKTKLGAATSVSDGYLKYQDWSIFNDKITKRTIVVVAMGQSNMCGHYTGGGDYSTNSDVLVWNGTAWVVADLNQSPFIEQDLYGSHPNNNLAFHFCKQLQDQTGCTIKLITSFHTGQPISHWIPASSAGYADMKTKISAGGITSVDVILWDQGEGNTNDSNAAYATYFNMLIGQLRSETFIQSSTPVICGEMKANTPYSNQNGFYQHINNYITDNYVVVAKNADLPVDGGVNDPYEIHFSGSSLVEMGRRRFYSAYTEGSYKAQRNNIALTDIENRWEQVQVLNKGAYLPTGMLMQFDAGSSNDYNIGKVYTSMLYNAAGGHIFNTRISANTSSPESGLNDLNSDTGIGNKGSARIYMGTIDATNAYLQCRDLSVNRTLNLSASSYIFGVGAASFASSVTASSFIGSGSTLTGVQRPITLTTNGTSGAATFSGNVLNVPNYSSNSVDQSLTTVNGSTGGDIVGSMPFQTANYKKVIVYVNFVSGNATYTFPTPFNTEWNVHTNTLGAAYSSVSVSGTSVTVTGATNAAGVLIIEGY